MLSDSAVLNRFNIWQDICQERKRQDEIWGADRNQSGYVWNAILTEEVGEVAKEVLEEDVERLYTELVQVAASAVAWMEAIKAGRLG